VIYGSAMVSGSLEVGVFMRTALKLNYQTLGFVKRGLVGTMIHASGIEPASLASLNWLALGYGVVAGFGLCLTAALMMRRYWQVWPCIGFLLSPAGLIQFGANYNLFDGVCAALFLAQILLLSSQGDPTTRKGTNRSAIRLLLIGLLGSIALLIHELYALAFLPLLLRLTLPQALRHRAWLLITPMAATMALIGWQGRYEPGAAALIAKLGPGTSTLELTSSLSGNLDHTMRELWASGLWRFSLPGFIFLLLVVAVAWASNPDRPQQDCSGGVTSARADILVACSPMLLGLIGVDINRWVALSVFNVMLLWLMRRIRLEINPRWLGLPLIAILALAGPVGVNGLAFPRLTGPLYEHYLNNKAAPKPSSTP
jgi:hypothetical protein